MKFSIRIIHKKETVTFRIMGLILAIVLMWLTLATASTSMYAQISDDVSSSAAAASSPADWTQFHRDNMQRWNPYETTLGVGNVAGLQLKWKNPIGDYRLVESSPAVVDSVVYVAGDADNTAYALNANTGAKLWSYAAGNQVDPSPAVANGLVYIGSHDNNIYALNASTGALIWKYTTGFAVDTSPAVVNGVVYMGSQDHNVYALNASTGAKLWSYSTGAAILSSPAVANGAVYVGSDDGDVYALNASTGAKLWSYATGGGVESSPAVANGVVYFGSTDFNVYALNASTGAKLWSYQTGNYVVSSPAVANGVVYISSVDGNLYALNASTGAKLWSSFTGRLGVVLSTSPAVANGVVYFGGSDGYFYALNASTGARLWAYHMGRSLWTGVSAPTIVNGAVYVRAGDQLTGIGNVYAFGLGSADLFLRVQPTPTTVHQGDLLTFAFPVWNLGPDVAEHEVLMNVQVPAGTTFDYVRISGTPGLGTCTHPPYGGTGQIVCHEGDGMAPNTTWTVRLTVKVTAPAGTVITESAATMSDTPDPNLANNTATVSLTVQ